MRNLLTLAATSAAAMAISGAAQAATFDFVFYAERERLVVCEVECGEPTAPEDYYEVGSGFLSYSGSVATGEYSFAELDQLDFEFNIDEFTYTEDDPLFAFAPEAGLDIFAVDGDIYARISGLYRPFAELSRIAIDAIPSNCFRGEVSILETYYDTCVNFGLSPLRLSEGDESLLAPFAVLPPDDFEDDRGPVGFFDPIYGGYIARAQVSEVPLPASLPLLAFAIGGMGYLRSRRG